MITFSFTVARPSVPVKADGVLTSGITVLTGQSGSGKSTFITVSYTHLRCLVLIILNNWLM